jgi:uncharacterized protein (TIGR03435 family)
MKNHLNAIPYILSILATLAYPRGSPPSTLMFDVASFRLNQRCRDANGYAYSSVDMPTPGRFVAINASLNELLEFAYTVKSYQLSGHPLLNRDAACYAVEAKTAPDTSEEQIKRMVQGLLAERLNLALHWEEREFPIYELLVGKNGPKLQRAKPDAKAGSRSDGGHGTGWQVTADKISMSGLANRLTLDLGRPVFDRTGVDGFYAITLQYAPEDSDIPDRPPVFTALQQQLGLKLEPAKRPIQVLIIDHAEKVPTEN